MVYCNNASDFYPYNIKSLVGASILSFLGLPGNVLVIILISRAKERKSTTTFLLLNLAIADVLHLLGVDTVAFLVFVVENLHDSHNTTLLLLCISGELVANFTLAMIALERHSSLTKTAKWCVNFTRKKFLVGIIVSWFIGLALSVLMHFSDEWVDKCKPASTWHYVYWAPPIVVGYFIPLVIQICCYWGLIKGLYFDKKILGRIVVRETVLNEKKRIIRTLMAINLVFLACNVPVIMILVLKHATPEWEIEGLYEAMLIVGILSSLVNPFIYGLQSDKYRSHIKELCCRKQKNVVEERSLPTVFDTKL